MCHIEWKKCPKARNGKTFQILLYLKFCIFNFKRVTAMLVVLGQ